MNCRKGMKLFIAVFIALSLISPLASAVPVLYGIKLTVETGKVYTRDRDLQSGDIVFEDERSAVGNVYRGLFSIDDSILAEDGLNKAGSLNLFVLKIEDNIWGYNFPGNNSFYEFVGPCLDAGYGSCGNPSSPGFDVLNGEIVNLRGAVRGEADSPYVDFSARGVDDRFQARGFPVEWPLFSWLDDGSLPAFGSMEVYRLPEPTTLSLPVLGLAGLGFARRRKLN